MNKRMVVTMATTLALVAAPVSAGVTYAQTSSPMYIKMWTPWTGTDTQPIDDMVRRFNETHSNIKVQVLNNQNTQKQEIALAGGTPPDVILTAWNDIGSWAPTGVVQSLQPYIQQSKYKLTDYIPVGLEQTQSNGVQFALPYALQVQSVLLYNKKDFAQAGIKTPPVTTSDLYQDAKKLTKRDASGNITQVGFIPDYPWLDVVFWPVVFGGSFYNKSTGKVTPNDPRDVQAINYEASFYKIYGGETAVNAFRSGLGKRGTPQDPLLTGQLAMAAGWDYNYPAQRGSAPSYPLGVVPFPYPTGHPELKNSGMISSDALFIPTKSQHKGEAWVLIQWLEQAKNQVAFSNSGQDHYSIPSVKSAVKTLLQNPKLKTMYPFYNAALSPNLKTFPNSSYINQYLQDLTDETTKVLNGQESAQAAMNLVQSEVQPLADKANGN